MRTLLSWRMRGTIKDWLIVLVSLLDDAAIALVVLLLLWFLKIPLSWPIIIFLVLFFIATIFVMHKLVLPALHKKTITGSQGMIGLTGTVTQSLEPAGVIRVGDEYWKAKSVGENIEAGEEVEIIKVNGLTLVVRLRVNT